MNQLPSDLQNIIYLHLPYDQICDLDQLGNNFWFNKAILDTEDDITPIWNLTETKIALTPKINYVRVMTYYGHIFKDSILFLTKESCFIRAEKLCKLELIKYFGGHNPNYNLIFMVINKIEGKEYKIKQVDKNKFEALMDLANGRYKEIKNDPEFLKKAIIILFYFNHLRLAEKLADKCSFEAFEACMLYACLLRNNLSLLKENFPTIKYDTLKRVTSLGDIPPLYTPIYRYLFNKIPINFNPQLAELCQTLGNVALKELLPKYPEHHFAKLSTYSDPMYIYLTIKYLGKDQAITLASNVTFRPNGNPESKDLLWTLLSKPDSLVINL